LAVEVLPVVVPVLAVLVDLLDPQPATISAAAQTSATGHVDWRTVPPHFLTGAELSAAELGALLDRAIELKAAPLSSRALAGRGVALIFEKPSTRTRVSFEMGVYELGGHAVVLRSGEMQLSRGESPRDTALVLSRQVAAIAIRTGPDELVEELAEHASVPVINMLTALHHPCQALADLMTMRESFGVFDGPTRPRLAYVGDGTNVARSLAILGTLAGLDIAVASPPGYGLEGDLVLAPGAEGSLTLYQDPYEAATGAHALYTDVWVSMGDESGTGRQSEGSPPIEDRYPIRGTRRDLRSAGQQRRAALAPYRIDDALLDAAAPGAIALHCLPAHAGEEITAEVLYGSRQRIWDQAENRRHAQKALLELLVEPARV
jgi:ornithine carbamoyltransferase